MVSIICTITVLCKICRSMGKGETYSPLGYLRRLAEEVPLRWTLKKPEGGGHIRQVVSMEMLTGLKVHDTSGEWCIVTHG